MAQRIGNEAAISAPLPASLSLPLQQAQTRPPPRSRPSARHNRQQGQAGRRGRGVHVWHSGSVRPHWREGCAPACAGDKKDKKGIQASKKTNFTDW